MNPLPPIGMTLERGRRASRLLTALMLVCMAVGLSACGEGADAPVVETKTNENQSGSILRGLTPAEGQTAFYVDSINGQVPRKNTPVVVDAKVLPAFGVGGWAVDQPATREAGGVIIIIDGKTEVSTEYGADRPDVVKFLKNPNFAKSGFTAAVNTATLEKGRHTLSFKVLTADKQKYYEPQDQFEIDVRK